MEEKVIEVLKEIGLGKIEIDTYIDLLRSRVSTASDIAKRTQQHRSNVYDALKRLQQKGFITETVEQNKRLFESKLPEVILSYLKQKESEVKSILPILEGFSVNSLERETTSVSYGLPRVRATLHNLFESEKEVTFWGVSDDVDKFLGKGFIEDYLKNMSKAKKSTKILCNGKIDKISALSSLKNQNIRYFKKQNTKSMIIISSKSAFMFVFNDPVIVIEMKGESISQWYSSQFDLLWRNSLIPFSFDEHVVKKATTFRKKSGRFLKKLISDTGMK